MPDIVIRLRGAHNAELGVAVMAAGALFVAMGLAAPADAAILLVLCGIVLGLLGFLLLGQTSNRSVLRIHEDRIEWERGFAAPWFASDPVPYSTVSGVFVAPKRRSILLIREGTRPHFVLIQPTPSDWVRAIITLRERFPRAPWVTSDLPLLKLLPPS